MYKNKLINILLDIKMRDINRPSNATLLWVYVTVNYVYGY